MKELIKANKRKCGDPYIVCVHVVCFSASACVHLSVEEFVKG